MIRTNNGTSSAPIQLLESEPDDKELTLAFKRGEDGAYQAIHARYAGRVTNVCRRMLVNPDDAAEASQEAFLRVYQALGRFNGRYQLGPWITRITTNVCLDHLRAKTRKPSDATPMEVFELEPDDRLHADPETVSIRNAECRRVRRVLEGLPPMHRAAIVLRDFEGLSYEEVAIALGVTDTQVKALIHRARQNFKRSWSNALMPVLLPIRHFLTRVRELAVPATEQASHVAGANACLITAGAEKVCALAAVVVVTGSLGWLPGQAHELTPPEDRSPKSLEVVTGDETAGGALLAAADLSDAKRKHHGSRHNASAKRVAASPEAPVGAPPADPAPEPSPTAAQPAPSPSPTQAPSGGNTPPAATPTPTAPPPEPAGFTLSFASSLATEARCSCLWSTQVDDEDVWIKDDGMYSYSQTARGTAESAGTRAFGLWLSHSSDTGDTQAVEFALRTDMGEYRYRAAGSLTSIERTAWGGWIYRYSGTYNLSARAEREPMPDHGTYRSEIVFSVSRAAVVSSAFSISEG